ncbi:hypothetical protein EDB83DRAFT_227112 [Lactarius deliciosus]|nr:hypothetical protein EDB83DRAFT_227112 [Lactarius deliciosus]
MSQMPPTASSNFQTIFYASIKEYEKKTKKDLLVHPLMVQLQTCNSPTDILAVLRTQVEQFEQSTSGDDKLTKWLDPTVNVLYAFSAALGEGVGLVNPILTMLLRSSLSFRISRCSHLPRSFSPVPESFFWRPRMSLRAKMLSLISSSASRASSDGSRRIPRCRRRRR